jgi:hypothetical protein
VRREDALASHHFQIRRTGFREILRARSLFEKCDDEECGMAFIHVEAFNVAVAERAQ